MIETQQAKPVCKVRGMVAPNAVCGHVIVGMRSCGFGGHCEHKSVAEMIIQFVQNGAGKQPD